MNKVEIKNNNILKIIKGTVLSLLITLVLLFIYSIVLTYSNVKENGINTTITIITGLSILIGSGTAVSKIKTMGIINGGIIGALYISILYILSSILEVGFKLSIYSLIVILVSIITGMLGGIIGVNLK